MGDQLENVLDLIHADNTAHADASNMPNQVRLLRARLATLDTELTKQKPQLPINGNDLIAMGLKPGPVFKDILGKITDAWFEDPGITREKALEIVRNHLKS
jgi:hypothetical protein